MARGIPFGLQGTVGKALLRGIDLAVEQRWVAAQRRAASTPGSTIDERVAHLTKAYAREIATVGAMSGAAAAVPGAGTAAVLSTTLADAGWVAFRSTELIMTIAALHGRLDAGVEERRSWVLAVLTFGAGAAASFDKVASALGKGAADTTPSSLPATAFAKVNAVFCRTIVEKYGTKRGVIALGKALPLGVGAAVGGTANYVATRTVARHADAFFRELPYSNVVDTTATEGDPPRKRIALPRRAR